MAASRPVLPGAPPVRCPTCGFKISWSYLSETFYCPVCGCGLRLRQRVFISWVAFALSVMIGVGISSVTRDWGLVGSYAKLFLLIVVMYLLALLAQTLFPPEIELTGDVRGILDVASGHEQSLPPDPGSLPVEVDFDLSAFWPSWPQSFEAWGIAIAFVALLGYVAWGLAEPVIYRVWPEYRATRMGPRDFPITVHLGADELRIKNRSSKHWQCTFTLGNRRVHYASAGVDGQVTTAVPWANFQTAKGAAQGTSQTKLTAARQLLNAYCVEPDGFNYLFDFR